MSLLQEYEQRTAWKYEPIHGFFHTADGLVNKVQPDGSYAPFPGTTVVFRPGRRALYAVELMQGLIRRLLEDTQMLAAPLPSSSIHMTLHDLVSPEKCASDPADKARYHQEMTQSLHRASAIVEKIKNEHRDKRIILTADRIVNMVSKSLVLILKPRTEEDYRCLMDMYGWFDEIIRLPYPLTPHITLAYFRPGMLDGDRLAQALEPAQIRQDSAPVFEFDVESLTAQQFHDMQRYSDVPKHICFCCDGGLNRSVMAANILNHMARLHGLPVQGTARSAFGNTQNWAVPDEVWNTLEKHGIQPDRSHSSALWLEDREASHFSDFAGITSGAMERISRLGLPEERIYSTSPFFFGVPDPEYGEATYEETFHALAERVTKYLNSLGAGDHTKQD